MKTKSAFFRSMFLKGFAIAALVGLLNSNRAEAGPWVRLYIDGYVGGMGAPQYFGVATQDTSTGTQGGDIYYSQGNFMFGPRVGLDFLKILTAQVRFDQYFDPHDGNRFTGSLGNVLVGFNFHFEPLQIVKIHVAALFGGVFVVTLQPQFPFVSDQFAKSGITGEIEGIVEFPIVSSAKKLVQLSLFVSAVVGYHYAFEGAIHVPSFMELQSQTHGFHFIGRAGLRLSFNLL